MEAKKFGDIYGSHATANYKDSDPKRAEVLEDARHWSHTYSKRLLDYLQGVEISESEAMAHQSSYTSWMQHSFSKNMQGIEPALDDPDYFHFCNELNFHMMNLNMRNIWIPVLTGASSIDRHEVQKSQNFLALAGVGHLDQRAKSLAQDEFYTKAKDMRQSRTLNQRTRTNMGVATETDTAISLLEITKKYPFIAVLPAPGQFEHSRNKSINSDFIVIDLKEKHARGIQTKSTIDEEDVATYDPLYVTLIDGSRDLDNTLGIRKPGSSMRRETPWPGLISAHHLLGQKAIYRNVDTPGQKGKNIDLGADHRMFVRSKLRARELANNTRSSNSKAASYVTQRVLADLYN